MSDLRGAGFCYKCNFPCMECTGRPENCKSCSGSGGYGLLYQERCYNECPRGTAPVTSQAANLATCTVCPQGCDLCDIEDKSICLKCTRPRFTHLGKCLDECPGGMHPNWPDGDGRSCRDWKLGDAGTAPYPFLITFAVFLVIILFGLMKRKAYLHKRQIAWESPQNTVACIIIAAAPLQFLACIAQ